MHIHVHVPYSHSRMRAHTHTHTHTRTHKHSYMDYLDLTTIASPGEPFCTTTRLDYSMHAFEHLDGVQSRRSLVAPPEKGVLSSVDNMRMDVFGSRVYHALEKVRTSKRCDHVLFGKRERERERERKSRGVGISGESPSFQACCLEVEQSWPVFDTGLCM